MKSFVFVMHFLLRIIIHTNILGRKQKIYTNESMTHFLLIIILFAMKKESQFHKYCAF